MAWADRPDHRPRRPPRRALRRARLALLRVRPHRAEPAHRQPRPDPHRPPPAGRRPHAVRPRRRRDGADRRPEDGGGAHPERRATSSRAGWSASASRSSRCSASTARTPRRMVNNLDWTAPLSAIDFLRDIGKHYRLGTMLAKDTVARRLNSDAGISFTEFSYQILQGMDYLELHRRHGITPADRRQRPVGQPALGRRADPQGRGRRRARAHDAADHQGGRHQVRQDRDRRRSGSTRSMTTPYAFFQFWLNADDADVVRYLKVFTFRSRERDRGARGGRRRPARPRARRSGRSRTR